MSRKSDLGADLMSIAVFAPLVIAERMRRLFMASSAPLSPRAALETQRMLIEKPFALVTAALAFQAEMLRLALGAWGAASPLAPMAAAVAPVRRRVRSNARRLIRRR